MTSFIYMLPLGGDAMHKPWGKSDEGFPCCWGTLTEQFSKLSDSIYFASPDESTIFVNQVRYSAHCTGFSARVYEWYYVGCGRVRY